MWKTGSFFTYCCTNKVIVFGKGAVMIWASPPQKAKLGLSVLLVEKWAYSRVWPKWKGVTHYRNECLLHFFSSVIKTPNVKVREYWLFYGCTTLNSAVQFTNPCSQMCHRLKQAFRCYKTTTKNMSSPCFHIFSEMFL